MNHLIKFVAFLISCLLLIACAAPDRARADEKPAPGRVAFKVLSGDETGLKAIVTKWKEDETKRQGGKLGWWPWGVGAFDYDNDGCLDLIVQQHAAPGSIILRGQFKDKGALTFTNVTDELGVGGAVLPGTFKPRIWDVDGDGWLDIVGSDAKPNTCFFNKGGKTFEAMKYGFSQLASLVDVGDLNGDGYPDTYSVREESQFLYDPAARTFKKSEYLPPLHAKPPGCIAEFLRKMKEAKNNRYLKVQYFEGVDLNGDVVPDVAVGGYAPYGGDSFARYLVSNKGELTDATAGLGLPATGTPILVADLTGDGAAEILVAAAPQGGLYVNDGKGKFTREEGDLQKCLAFRDSYIQAVSLVDFNNDGLPDLVISQPRTGNEEIYENRGNGKFERIVKARGWDADPIAVGDFNDDGLIDVIIGGPGDTLTVYLNQSAGAGHSCKLYPRMDKPNPFAVGAQLAVYASGELDKPGARPIWTGKANPDGAPLHVGLGAATTFDLRVTFPGKSGAVDHKKVQAKAKLRITPDGKLEEVK